MLVKDLLVYLKGDLEEIEVWLMDRNGKIHESMKPITSYPEADIIDISYENGDLSLIINGEVEDYFIY